MKARLGSASNSKTGAYKAVRQEHGTPNEGKSQGAKTPTDLNYYWRTIMTSKLILAASIFASISASVLAQPVDQQDVPTGFIAFHAPALNGQATTGNAIPTSGSDKQVKAATQDMPTSFLAFHAPALSQPDTTASAGITKTASK